MRKLAPKTRQAYIRAVRKFAKFLGRSPGTATDEDLRRFQPHLIDQGTSPHHAQCRHRRFELSPDIFAT